jgi:RNA polymerase sigma-70 factor (ECF subfamily)
MHAPKLSDAPLGGNANFAAVYESEFGYVWRNLRRLGVSDAQLDDATQDVFLVVHRRLGDFESRSKIRTWIFGIVLRIASTYRRTAQRRHTEPLDEHVAESTLSTDDLTDRAEAGRLLRRLLDELDDDRRAVFVLAELEQMTAPEVSAALGVNLNTVYSRLRSARRDINAALERLRTRSAK